MDSVFDAVDAEFGSDRVGTDLFGDVGVKGTAELPEGNHRLVVPDFDGDARSTDGVPDDFVDFRKEGVDVVELFGCLAVEPDHLHGADLEASL